MIGRPTDEEKEKQMDIELNYGRLTNKNHEIISGQPTPKLNVSFSELFLLGLSQS
jgi:hypothetical protein